MTPTRAALEALSECRDFVSDIAAGCEVTERSVQHAIDLRAQSIAAVETLEAALSSAPAADGEADETKIINQLTAHYGFSTDEVKSLLLKKKIYRAGWQNGWNDRGVAAPSDNTALREALDQFLCAWDSLPPGKHTSRRIEDWLQSDTIREAVSGARQALSASGSPGADVGQNSSDGGRTCADRTEQVIRSEAGVGRETDPSHGTQHGAGVAPGPSDPAAPQGQEAATEEELAEAMCAEDRLAFHCATPKWQDLSDTRKEGYRRHARVVLELLCTRAPDATEAVAWLCNGKGDGWEEKNKVVFTKENAEFYNRPCWTVQPLYTAPPAKPSVEAIARVIDPVAFANPAHAISTTRAPVAIAKARAIIALFNGGGDAKVE